MLRCTTIQHYFRPTLLVEFESVPTVQLLQSKPSIFSCPTWHDFIGHNIRTQNFIPYLYNSTLISSHRKWIAAPWGCDQLAQPTFCKFSRLIDFPSGKSGKQPLDLERENPSYINTISDLLHGLFRKVYFISLWYHTYKIFRTIYLTAKFDMGFSWAMFSRVLFLLLLSTFYSSGAEVVTFDVHATKDLINSGHKHVDVR